MHVIMHGWMVIVLAVNICIYRNKDFIKSFCRIIDRLLITLHYWPTWVQKNEFIRMDQIVSNNVKCYNLLARSTCQQLYRKCSGWLHPAALACEWSVPFRMSHVKHVCVPRLCCGCSIVSFPLIKVRVLLHNELVYIIIFSSNIIISIPFLI